MERKGMKKYQVICYMRIEPEEAEPLTYREALEEKKHLEFMDPESIYKIEKIEGDCPAKEKA